MKRRTRTGPGFLNQVGIDSPNDERRAKLNIRSCGVALIDVQRNDLIECRASGRTISQLLISIVCDLQAKVIAFQIIPLYVSHCSLP